MGRRNRGNHIPDGWQGCPSMGTGFVDNRFFVFKTPLNSDLNNKVSQSERFSIDTVFQQVEQMNNSRIGLWIDLTNTSRYYCPTQVQNRGVHYEKLSCEGHGKPPAGRTISAFCNMVNYFFRRNRRDYVGVHCTHGFNRTGYLICAYLIRYRKYTAAEAIQEFSRHREPGIYRQIYINDLFTMSLPLEMPIQVSEPEWLSRHRNQLPVPAFQQLVHLNSNSQPSQGQGNSCEGENQRISLCTGVTTGHEGSHSQSKSSAKSTPNMPVASSSTPSLRYPVMQLSSHSSTS